MGDMIGTGLFIIDLLELVFTLCSFRYYGYASPLTFPGRDSGAHSIYAL
jgi:hypothetical protein